MTLSMRDGALTGDYEDNTNGEPDALKDANPVRKGTFGKGQQCTSPKVYLTPDG